MGVWAWPGLCWVAWYIYIEDLPAGRSAGGLGPLSPGTASTPYPHLHPAGPTLEYVYHRAVLVLWPRSQSLALAQKAGPKALASTAAGAQEVLQAVLQQAGQRHVQRGRWGSVVGHTEGLGGSAAYVLELLVSAGQQGLPWAEQGALQVVQAMAARGGVADQAVAQRLAWAAEAFATQAMWDRLQQLVQRWAAAQPGGCAALVAAVAARPELQQALATAALDALRSSSPPAQAPSLLALVQAAAAHPELQRQLALQAAAYLLGSAATFAAQAEPGLLQLSALLLSSAELRGYYGAFAALCVQRPANQGLLKRLLVSAAVREARQLPGVQQLAAARAAQLEAQAAPPQFSWCMPQAQLPGYPQVGAASSPRP
jgi:hypothetical protein